MPPKKRTRRNDETVFYVVEIEKWDWSYSFGVNSTRHFDDPYLEFAHLQIFGRLLRPKAVKADRAELTFLPDKRLDKEARQQDEPTAVGSINLNRGTLQGLLSLPADGLNPILQMLTADRMRYVVLDGSRLRYRQGSVRHYWIDMKYDDDDLPPDEY